MPNFWCLGRPCGDGVRGARRKWSCEERSPQRNETADRLGTVIERPGRVLRSRYGTGRALVCYPRRSGVRSEDAPPHGSIGMPSVGVGVAAGTAVTTNTSAPTASFRLPERRKRAAPAPSRRVQFTRRQLYAPVPATGGSTASLSRNARPSAFSQSELTADGCNHAAKAPLAARLRRTPGTSGGASGSRPPSAQTRRSRAAGRPASSPPSTSPPRSGGEA